MADLTVTAADVQAGTGARTASGTAGGTVTAGQPVYKDASDSNSLKACDADASEAAAECVGIAAHAALDGQPLTYFTGGEIDIGATTVAAEVYVLSDDAGGICPLSDLGSGDYLTIVGYGKDTAGTLILDIKATGVQK